MHLCPLTCSITGIIDYVGTFSEQSTVLKIRRCDILTMEIHIYFSGYGHFYPVIFQSISRSIMHSEQAADESICLIIKEGESENHGLSNLRNYQALL